MPRSRWHRDAHVGGGRGSRRRPQIAVTDGRGGPTCCARITAQSGARLGDQPGWSPKGHGNECSVTSHRLRVRASELAAPLPCRPQVAELRALRGPILMRCLACILMIQTPPRFWNGARVVLCKSVCGVGYRALQVKRRMKASAVCATSAQPLSIGRRRWGTGFMKAHIAWRGLMSSMARRADQRMRRPGRPRSADRGGETRSCRPPGSAASTATCTWLRATLEACRRTSSGMSPRKPE